jgi:hypothetical protein
MANGKEGRERIDTETVRALLLINGGGAVALLALLPSLLAKNEFAFLAIAVLIGVLLFMCGLVCAVIHNQLRRECSRIYELHSMRPPPGKLFGISLRQPTVCFLSLVLWEHQSVPSLSRVYSLRSAAS